MHYLLYRTTNTINNKIYIGIHQTENITDGYLGSGKLLLRAIKKYGKDVFKKEILEYFNSEQEMVLKEVEVVSEEFCLRKDTYNVMPGGKWGSRLRNGLSFKGRSHSEESLKKIQAAATGVIPSLETRSKLSQNNFVKKDPDAHREASSRGGKAKKPKVTCPHCGKIGSVCNMFRYHFDNCKSLALKSTGADAGL